MLLNNEAYRVVYDELIYDNSHRLDGTAVQVAITSDVAGTIKRGQILDLTNNAYVLHATNGKPNCIVAKDVDFAADDATVTVEVYVSGAFRKSALIATPELTVADYDVLRTHGIFCR